MYNVLIFTCTRLSSVSLRWPQTRPCVNDGNVWFALPHENYNHTCFIKPSYQCHHIIGLYYIYSILVWLQNKQFWLWKSRSNQFLRPTGSELRGFLTQSNNGSLLLGFERMAGIYWVRVTDALTTAPPSHFKHRNALPYRILIVF